MQVVIPRWRNLFISKSSIVSFSSANWGLFHTTPVYSEKWKNKWNSAFRQPQSSSKNYIRYATRQNRAAAKRALKDILFKNGSSTTKITIQNYFPEIFGKVYQNVKQEDHLNCSDWKQSSKPSADRATKAKHGRMKRKIREECYEDDFNDHFERVFEAKFGKWYTWSYINWKESKFEYSNNDFEWRNRSNWTKNESWEWKNASYDANCDEGTHGVGSSSDRKILGLPLKGPLKMDDVKKAFRLSALKWHPDKHQSSSQAMAEEKFKHCVDAYNSLCAALF